jgi:Glycosyl transferase family 2
MNIVALMQTYNQRQFVANCIENLNAQGVSVHVTDNESTDGTVEIAECYLGQGVVGIEQVSREECPDLPAMMRQKERLAETVDADWLIHVEADELHITPDPRGSVGDALRAADEAGFNAVNFIEFTFVPTVESPDHDHSDYPQTMRSYYPYLIEYPHRLNAWKRQDEPVDLVSSDGHRVAFGGLLMAPRNLYMRHFLFLSLEQAREKYEALTKFYRTSIPRMRTKGNWRIDFDISRVTLPSERELRYWVPGQELDRSEPLNYHLPILPVSQSQAAAVTL